MKKLLHYTELTIFLFVNIFFSAGVFIVPNLFFSLIKSGKESDEHFLFYAFWGIVIWVLFLAGKIIIFPLIYLLKSLFPNVHNFLFNFANDAEWRKKPLIFILLLDFLVLTAGMMTNTDLSFVIIYILFGFGVLTNYLFFMLIYKLSLFLANKIE